MRDSNLCLNHLYNTCYAFIFVGILLIAGCEDSTSSGEPDPQIKDALILLDGSDSEANIETGEAVKFSGYALTESGEQIPLSELNDKWSWEWESTDATIFTVDAEGNATGKEEGEAYCVITLNGPEEGTGARASKQGDLSEVAGASPGLPEVNLIFVGRDSAFVSVSGGF